MLVLPKPLWYAAVPVSGLVMIGYTVARMWKVIGRPAENGGHARRDETATTRGA